MFERMRSEDGGTAVYFALMAPVLIGAAALATEVGMWLSTERKLQHIADAAAYTAAARSAADDNITEYGTLAMYTENYIEPGVRERALSSGMKPTDELAVKNLTPSDPNDKALYWEVTIERTVPRLLSAIFTRDDLPVEISVRAVASQQPQPPSASGGPVCLLALSPAVTNSREGIFTTGGGGPKINASNCGVASNSGFGGNGGQSANVKGKACYSRVGFNINVVENGCDSTLTLPGLITDPYANIARWTASFIDSRIPLSEKPIISTSNKKTTIEPSRKIGNVPVARLATDFWPNNTDEVILRPGVYIIDKDFELTGKIDVSGAGVNIVVLKGAKLTLRGNGKLNLTTIHSGSIPTWATENPYRHFSLFAEGGTQRVTHSLGGNAGSFLNGIVYLPRDDLYLFGTAGMSANCIQVVANRIEGQGNAAFAVGCAQGALPQGSTEINVGQGTGQGTGRTVSLVE